MKAIAEANEKFRKTPEGFAAVMIPNANFENLKALGFIHQALASVQAYEFPTDDTSDRNMGTIEISGHTFKWEICYIPPGKTHHDEKDFPLEPVSDHRQMRVYVPTNDL